MSRFHYIRDPDEIERRSFARIRELTDLSRFDDDQAQVAMRLVHTCGDPSIVAHLAFSPGACAAGLAAMRTGAPILCDVEMVRHGLNRRLLGKQALCYLNDPRAAEIGRQRGETRSMAALELWREHLEGSIAAIGNAPTALFRLLELLDEGAPRPALIVGMPVGFIGAVESKQALAAVAYAEFGVPWITVHGLRGGSALTAAAVNALGRLARGIRF
ncbi:MAG TPA: precorrin-8X methylmutase [Candidatus Competibacteraceae bacterium]|nr:precorrin-8X methylmutase [Candidatus Competibacteraceae bacterium]